jgi:hypothetical protein
MGRKAQGPEFASEWGLASNTWAPDGMWRARSETLALDPIDRKRLPPQIRDRGQPIRHVAPHGQRGPA